MMLACYLRRLFVPNSNKRTVTILYEKYNSLAYQ